MVPAPEAAGSSMETPTKTYQTEGPPSSHLGFPPEYVSMAADGSSSLDLETQPYQPQYGITSSQGYYQDVLPEVTQTDWTPQQLSTRQIWSEANIDPALRAPEHAGTFASLSSHQRLEDDPYWSEIQVPWDYTP